MYTVKIYIYKIIPALRWLCSNITDYDYKNLWNINNYYISPDIIWLPDNLLQEILLNIINVNNKHMAKTDIININFEREEDAIWFKTIWGGD